MIGTNTFVKRVSLEEGKYVLGKIWLQVVAGVDEDSQMV